MTVVVDTSLENGQMVIASPQEAVNIRQLCTIIYRRRGLILGVASIVMSVATLLSVVIKPTREDSDADVSQFQSLSKCKNL